MKFGRIGLALLACAGLARNASAASILVTGDLTFTVNWLYTPTTPDLSGSAQFTISNYSSSGFDLKIDDIKNTTPTSPNISARLVSFGFGLTPDGTFSNEVNGAVYSWGTSNFPGFSSVDVCGFAGNNCAGGANAGLGQGESTAAGDFMSIRIAGNFGNGVTFAPIAVKFQTALGSYELDDNSICTTNCGIPTIPEPGSLLLLGTGLAGLVTRIRKRPAAR